MTSSRCLARPSRDTNHELDVVRVGREQRVRCNETCAALSGHARAPACRASGTLPCELPRLSPNTKMQCPVVREDVVATGLGHVWFHLSTATFGGVYGAPRPHDRVGKLATSCRRSLQIRGSKRSENALTRHSCRRTGQFLGENPAHLSPNFTVLATGARQARDINGKPLLAPFLRPS